MPRLPTMRVIGSHAISVKPSGPGWLPAARCLVAVDVMTGSPSLVAGLEHGAWGPPGRFLVQRVHRELAQRADHCAIGHRGCGGDLAAGGLVHEGHELVREARHRAADADTTHVRTAADAVDPAALRHVAVDHRAPAAEFHDALR